MTTSYRYDPAGRAVGVKVGNAAEQVQAFDAKNRVVFRSDGDQASWRGRYDAWDRLWLEHQPSGAVVEHFYDPSNRPTQQKVWAGDPTSDPENEPRLLKDTRTTFTSFGEVKRVVEVLTTDEAPQVRVTERDFDAAGRMVLIASGPANEAGELDRAAARREQQIRYEPLTGRVLRQSSGGSLQGGTGEDQGQEIEQRFEYAATSPWPTKVQMLERLPGGPLQETTSATFRYDAAGRVVEERRSDGSLVETLYDRLTGQPLRVSSGAGSTSYASYDGAGKLLLSIRPGGRGETLYAYDLDGRLRRQVTKTEAEDWETSYGYDALGRPTRVDYEDGSFATSTYNADSTVAERRTRDGLTLSHTYDAANRLLAVVPSGEPAATMADLDAGNETTWDPLSRPTEHRRGDPSLAVAYPSYDLGSRPAGEKVGDREALGWAWDLYDRAIETRLPLGVGRNADLIAGFKRQFDTLNHLTGIEALSGQPQTLPLGGTWSWSGGRLWGMTTRGTLGTAVRYGYLGGAGAQPPGQAPASWQLGTMTWGAGAESATVPPSQIWGQFAFGYRGTEATPSDGAKIGRLAVPAGKDLFAGTGWSWNYDAGVRLAAAKPGRGSLEGASEENSPSFRYQYGKADELQKIIDEAAGKASTLETGPYGRILSRDGVPFEYDASGRRTEDDRHSYKWNWRGELVEVKVKQGDFAGHQVKYQYDAQGRLHTRSHYGPADSNGQRLLQEKRAFLWEGQSLLAEAAYTDEAQTQIQWRKTYVPGPSGLDDAIQVKVENFAAPGIPGSRLYTYLRDELGTVIGIVGEEEAQNPANPTIAARYLYNPYGEAHLEKGLEIKQVRFDESDTRLGTDLQTIEDPAQRSPGALIVTFAAALDDSSFAGGVVVERHDGAQWLPLGPDQLLVGTEDALELNVLVRYGWERGASYRVRLAGILDTEGRGLAQAQNFEWKIAADGASSDFSKVYGIAYDSAKAAVDTVGGRFPGGQNSLFQGLWTEPISGVSYARARWFEPKSIGWLSEDLFGDLDSVNLTAFVGFGPHSKIDPEGLYERDFHYSIVYHMAHVAFGDPQRAYVVAFASQFVDDFRPTAPIPQPIFAVWQLAESRMKTTLRDIHFVDPIATGVRSGTENELLMALTDEVVESGDDLRLGIALHSYADSFSHEGFTWNDSPINDGFWEFIIPEIGHGQALHNPDRPYLDPDKAADAALEIYDVIWRYAEMRGIAAERLTDVRRVQLRRALFLGLAANRSNSDDERAENWGVWFATPEYNPENWHEFGDDYLLRFSRAAGGQKAFIHECIDAVWPGADIRPGWRWSGRVSASPRNICGSCSVQ